MMTKQTSATQADRWLPAEVFDAMTKAQKPVSLGVKVHNARAAKGMTLLALAAKSGISKGNLSKIESGRDNITISTLCALARALGVKPGVLLPK